jgi:hypothetical protein
MLTFNRGFYSFKADATALGGYLEEPFQMNIPTLAPVSLPPVGGFAMARSEGFTLDEIVSCTLAYTRVSGRQHEDGSISTLVTSVVEGLNLLDKVKAKRIVSKVSVSISKADGLPQVSFAGSGFEGLQLAGRDYSPKPPSGWLPPKSDQAGTARALTWQDIEEVGRAQAERLIESFRDRDDEAKAWAQKRYEWTTRDPQSRNVRCSLVDGLEGADPKASSGCVVEIPDIGRIILGEILLSRDSVQLVAIRADLGCPTKGKISICAAGGGGVHDN